MRKHLILWILCPISAFSLILCPISAFSLARSLLRCASRDKFYGGMMDIEGIFPYSPIACHTCLCSLSHSSFVQQSFHPHHLLLIRHAYSSYFLIHHSCNNPSTPPPLAYSSYLFPYFFIKDIIVKYKYDDTLKYSFSEVEKDKIKSNLLNFYDCSRRLLPWRGDTVNGVVPPAPSAYGTWYIHSLTILITSLLI